MMGSVLANLVRFTCLMNKCLFHYNPEVSLMIDFDYYE